MHIHVVKEDKEAKIWLEPEISVAKKINLSDNELNEIVSGANALKG